MPERAFRNAVALSLLLVGLALVCFSIGGVLAFVADIGTFSWQGDAMYDAAFRITVLVIALMYFFVAMSMIQSRPRYATTATIAPRSIRPTALMAARTFSLILFLLGVLLLFNFTPYGRDTTLAAVMILAGIFGVAGTIMYAKPDRNVAAVGAVLGIIAALMLLYAQVTVQLPEEPSGTYGAWETTNLIVPPVLGPIAIVVAAGFGVAYAYARTPRMAAVCFIGFGVGALVYGIGLCLVGLATVLDIPWYQFTTTTGNSMLQLLAMTAGLALLVSGGVACIVAALISFVRTARGLQGEPNGTDRDGRVIATTGTGITGPTRST